MPVASTGERPAKIAEQHTPSVNRLQADVQMKLARAHTVHPVPTGRLPAAKSGQTHACRLNRPTSSQNCRATYTISQPPAGGCTDEARSSAHCTPSAYRQTAGRQKWTDPCMSPQQANVQPKSPSNIHHQSTACRRMYR
ncbi:hypothetical protein GE061_006657 [Apolygus lucorum]|uniref:Uncharacterized protein n=1 Tax=Apolygus lucorum TaxID=248454 RepID=A0A8S9WVW0_APOLU|nr:hypothetical protein GE061_006657 [Apolygus lucorum]